MLPKYRPTLARPSHLSRPIRRDIARTALCLSLRSYAGLSWNFMNISIVPCLVDNETMALNKLFQCIHTNACVHTCLYTYKRHMNSSIHAQFRSFINIHVCCSLLVGILLGTLARLGSRWFPPVIPPVIFPRWSLPEFPPVISSPPGDFPLTLKASCNGWRD